MKYILILISIFVLYSIVTDNMGGAKDASSNYNKVFKGGDAADDYNK